MTREEALRAFVTGGSGFLGKHLIQALCKRGFEVSALARSNPAAETIRRAGGKPIFGDIRNPETLRAGMKSCTTVYHAAGTVAWWGKEEEMIAHHVTGTRNVVEAARVTGVKTLVHISAAAVISEGKPIRGVDETVPIPQRPLGAYARTKAAAEKFVRMSNGHGLRTVAVRPPAIWGSGDPTLLPELARAVQRRRFVWINHGDYPYATCHVRNVCEGAILAAAHGRGGDAYFLTDGVNIRFREFVTRLLETRGLAPPKFSIPRSAAGAGAAMLETVYRLFRITAPPPVTRSLVALIGGPIVLDDQKARRVLGYQPFVSVKKGMAELQEGFKNDGHRKR